MKNKLKTLIIYTTVIIQLSITIYLGIISFLFASWPVSIPKAFEMSTFDWLSTAFIRGGTGIILAFIFGMGIYFMNYYGIRWTEIEVDSKKIKYTAIILSVIIIVSTLAGSIFLFIEKPMF